MRFESPSRSLGARHCGFYEDTQTGGLCTLMKCSCEVLLRVGSPLLPKQTEAWPIPQTDSLDLGPNVFIFQKPPQIILKLRIG